MNRARLLPAALLVLALAGCGGSVADRDRPDPARERAAPASPFCAAVLTTNTALAPLSSPTAQGIPAEQLTNTAEAVRAGTAQLLDTAPEEIRADVERYVRVVDLQLDALVANGGDSAALAGDAEFTAQVDTPENTTASQRVRDYVARNCVAGAAG
ncbi:hypothetical protein [Pseudonocardia abyssalis]|uniref:Lipoprotein n=1 Tax=Pseudonocardia abyssalis TaxID=2792008 RepID=A0ABS6UL41_9PSEU|nr:hypothetical protein [Pseudonocardia abyssalis]MBW0114629.1 hypothetical protein [Pseudonocardia abyssalis]MBW0132981.1 hypothetical protein [Pseudonocardia abyssalis]